MFGFPFYFVFYFAFCRILEKLIFLVIYDSN